MSQYSAGQIVYYRSANSEGAAEIVHVHYDDSFVPYYTIKVDGMEKQTDDAHLSPIAVGAAAVNHHQEDEVTEVPTSSSRRKRKDYGGVIDLTSSRQKDDSSTHVVDLLTEATDAATLISPAPARKRQRREKNNKSKSASSQEQQVSRTRQNPAFSTSHHHRRRQMRPFDCPICLSKVERVYGRALIKCGHVYCCACLQNYVKTQLADKKTALDCPNTTCRLPLESSDIRACTVEVGDPKLWHDYEELSTQTWLDAAANSESQNTDMRRCPTDRCNFIFQLEQPPNDDGHQREQGVLFICPDCDEAYCLNCPVVQGRVGPAHDETCAHVLEQVRQSEERRRKLEEWQRENAQADARFRELLQSERAQGKTKACPKCRFPITKNGGCDHMHCSNCLTDFGWSQA